MLNTLPAEDLAAAFRELGDEPEADKIAAAIVRRRATKPLERTRELMDLILEAAPVTVNPHPRKGEPTPRQQQIRPTARVFQALRILVNRELANLQELLRVLPWCLRPGGRAAIISFHSGEDRLVKAAFKEGQRTGVYERDQRRSGPAGFGERMENPRSRSAKLRWADQTGQSSHGSNVTALHERQDVGSSIGAVLQHRIRLPGGSAAGSCRIRFDPPYRGSPQAFDERRVPLRHKLPVDHLEEGVDVVGPLVLVLQVVGVLPDVDAEDRPGRSRP